jgi:hypothetical protein
MLLHNIIQAFIIHLVSAAILKQGRPYQHMTAGVLCEFMQN